MFLRPGLSFAEATNLPLSTREALEPMGLSTMTVADSVSSPDGTTKLLLRAQDGATVEAVVMRYRQRVTACISSQVGCPVGCAFCATGGLGFTRNLSPAEIVDQVRAVNALLAVENRRISNLVYMGMGEPLLNLSSVLDSIRILTAPHGLNLAHRSLSVSTVGIPAGIRRLAKSEPQLNVAISLHAADDATRALLIPPRFRHPIAAILDAAWEHFALTKRKVLVEYVLIGGVNDSPADARHLAELLRGHVVTVNLLVWNPVPGLLSPPPTGKPAARFRAPTAEAVAAFRAALTDRKIEAVVRQSKGAGIQAACGQLAAQERSYLSNRG
jgi:23S rRNA (adenine2503-C2)-methyltransferase